MKVARRPSSEKLVPCLFVVAFLVAVAFGSDKIERPSGTEERGTGETDFNRLKRKILETLRAERSTMETSGGSVYIRWGRTVCNNGSDVVYGGLSGVAGGSWYDVYGGGGSNFLCLPKDPIWGDYLENTEKFSKLYGSEYRQPWTFGLENNNGESLDKRNVPCVVCQSQAKTSVVMIPARNQCYNGWSAEYAGYLMGGADEHKGRTEFICVDGSPESDKSGWEHYSGALLFQVDGVCGSLPCPPYIPYREITCVVCTK